MINKRLLKESNFKRFYIVVSVVSSIFNALFIVISAYLLSAMISGIFLNAKTFKDMKIYFILFIANALLKFTFNFVNEIYIKNSAEDIKGNFREKLFHLVVSANPYKVKNEKLGEVINLITEATEMIGQYYSEYIPQFFAAFIIPLLICLGVAYVDKISALIMVITYPLIPIFMILIGFKSKAANEKQWKKLNLLSSHFIDMLQGLSTLKLFGISKRQEDKIYEISENHRKATMEVLRVSFLSALVLELFSTISTALVAVNLGLRLVYDQISFFSAFFILVITPDFYLPVRQLGLKFHASLNGVVAIEKIEEFEKKLAKDSSLSNIEMKENKFEIEVKDLEFFYDDKKVLKNLNFKITAGEKVALIGESGSGKSTLINILSGFLKVQDNMVLINGKDINQIENYFDNIALVPQFPHIFNKSIKENICVGYKDLDENELLKIYKYSKINEFCEAAEGGDETVIGEGENLTISGGEAQRIAIARAMVKNSNFIIFDEPSSALDSEKEELILEAIQKYFKTNTVLIAAHRLNTIKMVDKIIMLNEGRIIEMGTHKELMEKQGEYYKLMMSTEVEK
ncbi:thiol reductant ABC exporter subunit CydD [Clostridium saccharoperbutylacetonicum]|uniref:thiol reductant ABC exporter subunit CydD n=1 Tax=Clostridium saccharoperbutylacetonicum TaxID=36745 RepID=UPI000983DD10|nr:thiol reductant ABC exporter subunit CydD [Clostridium saccharoperbutylacetonicum]AQR96298.1 ATP-binding/permease protein CydD [Clostridium saccharoperbutylacetonicum]NSB32171.1 ATP-binding cassette subfamily C protein CydD [Clostridium saccharoperbutylacetonicum]